MKWPLVATRLGIVAFKLMVAAIVVLSISPLLTGGIGLDLDGGSDGGMTLEGSTIRIEIPMTVRNDGFFDINDLQVSFIFMNQEGEVLAESEGEQMDIPAGEETDVTIEIALDLFDLDQQVRSDLIFNGTEMMFDAKISAKYTLDMVQLSVEAGSDMRWGPFISDLQVEERNAQAVEEGDDRFVNVPFHFRADDVLNGLQTITVTEYRDESGYTSNATQSVHLSQQVNEIAKIPLSQEAYDRLINNTANATVRTTIYILDCSTYDEGYLNLGGGGGGGGGIGDPIYDLDLQWESASIYSDGYNHYLIVSYSFRTYQNYYGQQAQVYLEYRDTQGIQGSVSEFVVMWDQVSNTYWIQLTQEAYDRVNNGDEQVGIRLNVFYQSYNGLDEQVFIEQWGVSP
jgi:hypothetical protein